MNGTASSISRWTMLLAVPTTWLGVSLAWALASPAQPAPAGIVRSLADGIGSVVLGLAALDWLVGSGDRSRRSLERGTLWRPIAFSAAVWAFAEAVLLLFEAADVGNGTVSDIGMRRFGEFLAHITAGQVGVATIACTVAIAGYAAFAFRRSPNASMAPPLALAALALTFRPITGHMSQQTLGPILGATHALAAATWFGTLVAMALMVRSRGAWADLLPRYSEWAWRCVAVLAVTGVINAAVRLGGVGPVFDTAYGRIVLAKVIALALLMTLGWWWRRTWVREAGGHRMSADDSFRRAFIEIAAMGVAFGLAAALATTA